MASTANGIEWSVTGVGGPESVADAPFATARGVFGSFTVTRRCDRLGLEAEVGVFAPETDGAIEVLRVTLRNTGALPVVLQPTYAIPVFGRSADNVRSHRHVTSLLNRVAGLPFGFRFKPSMNFDERGHRVNATAYFVAGFDGTGRPPIGGWASLEEFCGPRFGLTRPDAVYGRCAPRRFDGRFDDGREAVGALRFADVELPPGESCAYTIVLAIAEDGEEPAELRVLGAPGAATRAQRETEERWRARLSTVRVRTGDSDFDQWFRWVQWQPFLRRIHECVMDSGRSRMFPGIPEYFEPDGTVEIEVVYC